MKPSDYRLLPAEPAKPQFHTAPVFNVATPWPYLVLIVPAIMVAAIFLMGK